MGPFPSTDQITITRSGACLQVRLKGCGKTLVREAAIRGFTGCKKTLSCRCQPRLQRLRKNSGPRCQLRTSEVTEHLWSEVPAPHFRVCGKLWSEVPAPDFRGCGKTLVRGASPGLQRLRKNSGPRCQPRTSVRGKRVFKP